MKQKMIQHMHWYNQFYSLIRRKPSSKIHLVFIYRYISLLLTSCFFLLGPPPSSVVFKIDLVFSLGVAALILTDLLRRNIKNNRILMAIVLTETIGLTLLLVPTGGIASPFIWYALNPVLVAASFLTPSFCWGILAFYLSSATFIAYSLFNQDNILQILKENSYIYLVCLLFTFLLSLFSGLTKVLDSKAALLKSQQEELLFINKKLAETNGKYQDTLEHIMSLYHVLESSHKCPERLAEEITTTLMKCTQKEAAFFWVTDSQLQINYFSNKTNNANLENYLKMDWHNIREKKESFIRTFNKDNYWIKTIRTSKYVGVLGVKVSDFGEVKTSFLFNRTFDFLAELSEMILERMHMHQIMDQMLILEEQNRIANEIHDSVSQRLFGIVYSLHSLRANSKNITPEKLEEEYQFLSKTANTTMKELRASIYKLSSVKKGDKAFFNLLENYLTEYAKLNDIKIYYQLSGDESLLSEKFRNGLYRIICEACGNAVRHGECTMIVLTLAALEGKIILEIEDNGIGIHLHHQKKEKGIGLMNMKSITNSFGGTFSLEGLKDTGTKIQIEIPNVKTLIKQEVLG